MKDECGMMNRRRAGTIALVRGQKPFHPFASLLMNALPAAHGDADEASCQCRYRGGLRDGQNVGYNEIRGEAACGSAAGDRAARREVDSVSVPRPGGQNAVERG